jgi:hypothetical protein
MSDLLHVSAADLPPERAVTSYLSLLDQEGNPWFLFVNDLPTFVLADSRPSGIELASRQTFSWIYVVSPSRTGWYVYPSTYQSLLFSTDRPQGQGISATAFGAFAYWWSPSRMLWTVSMTDAPDLVISGSGQIEMPGTHTIRACRRCSWVGHVDRSNAKRDQHGQPLLNRCPRDGTPFDAEDVYS